MKKDAYHFPHFCNARHDRKIRRMRKELGIEGYGIFFMLLEVLREQTDFKYPLSDIDLLAEEFGTSDKKVAIVIKRYDLFTVDKEEKFFSPKLLLYLQPYFEKSERARNAALIRWDKVNKDANALPKQSASNASKVKESKVKESKVKESKVKGENKFSPPTYKEVLSYCRERRNDVNPEKWHDFYVSKGWMIGKNKMKDWKAAVRTWESKEKPRKRYG